MFKTVRTQIAVQRDILPMGIVTVWIRRGVAIFPVMIMMAEIVSLYPLQHQHQPRLLVRIYSFFFILPKNNKKALHTKKTYTYKHMEKAVVLDMFKTVWTQIAVQRDGLVMDIVTVWIRLGVAIFPVTIMMAVTVSLYPLQHQHQHQRPHQPLLVRIYCFSKKKIEVPTFFLK